MGKYITEEVKAPDPPEKDGYIWSSIKNHPFYTGAAAAGIYALYRHQKKKDNKQKEVVIAVQPKFDKNTDILTGLPKSKYDLGD